MPPTRAPAGPQAGGSQPSTEAPVARAGRTNNNATGAPRKGAQHAGGGAENAPPEHEGAGTPSAPAATAAGVGNAAVVQKPVAWWHFQGQLAGSTAQSALAKGEKVTAEDSEAPANVAAAGQVAVDAWQTGFMSCFKFEPNKYAAGVPLANSRKRKSKEPDEPKEGRAALESDRGKAELSAFVYHHVREEFFLTKDGCKNELFYWLTDKERDYAIDEEKEYDPWWVEVGQRAVNKKGVTARASMMARVKECIWREYIGGTPVVFTDPRDKKKKYDCTTAMGTAATELLTKWQSLKTADNVAPWRQNVAGGQFGEYKWVLVLKAAFDVPGDAPHFKLWQANSMLQPCNANAIYWNGHDAKAHTGVRRGNPMGDTEKGTSEWMEVLEDALNNKNPDPIEYSVDGEERTFSFTIEDFDDADQPPASQLPASQHPPSQPR